MSNRILGIIILSMFILAGYLYFYIEYIPEQEAKKIQEINLQKQIAEKKKDPELVKQKIDKVELTNKQKIEEIKKNKKNYKTFTLNNSREAYFIENNNKLDLFLDKKKIGNFDLVYKEYLRLELIDGTENDLFLEVGKDKFYYNFNTGISTLIKLNIDVLYVKKGNNNLIFVTNKGSFVYSPTSKSLEYFSYFNDFIYFDNGYIGLVKKDEKRILSNLGIESDKNLIIYYNPNTKEKNIIYKTDLDIKKLYIFNEKVYIVSEDGEKFELENIKNKNLFI